jgi:hypothetical protein
MAGRKKAEVDESIDVGLLEIMCRAQETTEVIAEAFGVSRDSLERRYLAQMKQWRADGKMSFRRAMFLEAMGGVNRPPNTAVMIFWAKNYLKMRDNPEPTVNFNLNADIENEGRKAKEYLLEELKRMDERVKSAHFDRIGSEAVAPAPEQNGNGRKR